MRWLKNQSWMKHSWLWGGVGLMLLNLWAGCSEQPPVTPIADKSPPAAKNSDPAQQEKKETPPEQKENPDPPAQEVAITDVKETPGYGETADTTATSNPDENVLFKDWPEPKALLIFSGDQKGYIEPCGCAGLENQKGGLKRRHTFVKQMQERGWPIGLFDIGEQVRRFGIQPEIKFRTAIQSLEKIGYKAIGFGPDDLQLPAEQLLLLELPPQAAPLFVSANVVNEFAPEMVVPFKIVTVGEKKIAVTGVLGAEKQELIRNEGIQIQPAAEALAAIVPKMQAEADYLVLLASSTLDEAKDLGKQFPAFNLVVTATGDVPPLDKELIEGTEHTYWIDVAEKGMHVVAIGLYDDPDMPIRYEVVPLDKRFPDSPEMKKLFDTYQKTLRAIGLKGLDMNPRGHASGSEFVGSKACADCHTKAFEIWEKTPHAHATETLIGLDPQRQFDAECLSCHVTGWELNPGTYMPYLSGYMDEKSTAHLFGNGCENCHGPGSAHVKAESGEVDADEKTINALREQMRLPLAMAEATCVKCHDHDNSPNFGHEPKHPGDLAGFAEYWKHVEHKGKD